MGELSLADGLALAVVELVERNRMERAIEEKTMVMA